MRRLFLLLMILAIPAFAQDQSADLRKAAGCGPAEMKFSVKSNENQHAVAKPEPGKALVYVIEEERPLGNLNQIGHVTARVGLDGNWVGANHGNSYFSFAVEPGKHSICSDWQSMVKSFQRMMSGAATFTAEEGKTYFFRVQVRLQQDEHPARFELGPIDDAQGSLLISKSALSTSKAKK